MADLSFPGVRNQVHPVNAAQEAALRRLGWADATPSAPEPPAEPDPEPSADDIAIDEIPDLPPPPPSADQES